MHLDVVFAASPPGQRLECILILASGFWAISVEEVLNLPLGSVTVSCGTWQLALTFGASVLPPRLAAASQTLMLIISGRCECGRLFSKSKL
jgi:hypothetical protein